MAKKPKRKSNIGQVRNSMATTTGRPSYRMSSRNNLGISVRRVNRDGAGSYGTLYNYTSSQVTAATDHSQKKTIGDRAWDLYTNDAATSGLIETLAVDIAGPGLTPIVMPMTKRLGLSPEWEDEYQETMRELWELWGLSPSKYCDATRRMNINQMMFWAVFSWKLEGIALFQVKMYEDVTDQRLFSLYLNPIAAHRLMTPYDMIDNPKIFDGIEVDSNGAPLAFWIKKGGNENYSSVYDTSEYFDRMPAYNPQTGWKRIIACYTVRNISEYRSESVLTSILKTIRDRHDHKDNALVGAIVANLYTVFRKGGLRLVDPQGNTLTEPMIEVNGGTIINGDVNEDIQVIKTDRPGPHFKDMDYSTIEELGMATGRGFEKVLKKWEASFSASRMSLLQASKFDRIDQKILVDNFCQPVLRYLAEEAVNRSYVNVRQVHFYQNQNKDAYTKTKWLAPPLGDVDQKKAEEADAVALAIGSKTVADFCAERNLWWKDVRRQRAKELAYDKALEKEFKVTFAKGKSDVKPDKPKDNDEGENEGDSSDKENENKNKGGEE